MAYGYKRSLTIDHTQCGSSNSSNFPVLVKLDASNAGTTMKTVGNGGRIQNTTTINGQTVPADLAFYSDSGGVTILKHDIESYDATNGIIWAWVRVPTISSSSNTTFYVFYGDSGVTTYQGGSVGDVWTNSYVGVWHMADGSTLNLNDSSGSTNTLTNHSVTATTGQIDGGSSLSGSQYFDFPGTNFPTGNSSFTASAWINTTGVQWQQKFFGWGSTGPENGVYIGTDGTTHVLTMSHYADDHNFTTALSSSTWYYVVFTHTGTTDQAFINSVSDGTVTTGTLTIPTTFYQLGGISAFAEWWHGTLDEMHVATGVRGQDWITTEYNNQLAPETFITTGSETVISTFTFQQLMVNLIQPRDIFGITTY